MSLPSRISRRQSVGRRLRRRTWLAWLMLIMLDLLTISLVYTAYTTRDLPGGIIAAGTYLLFAVILDLHGIRTSLPGVGSPSRVIRASTTAVAILLILVGIYGVDSYFDRWGNPWEQPPGPPGSADAGFPSQVPAKSRMAVPVTSKDSPQFTGTVTAIVDPTTMLLDDGLEVSLAHLKAPASGTPAHRLALDLATNALLGQEVTVVPCLNDDAEAANSWSPLRVSGVVIQALDNFNLRLLVEGGATFSPDPCQNMDLSQWSAYQEIAKTAKLGVWGPPSR